MGEPHDRSLQERVEQLESAVEEIQRMLKQLYETSVQKDLNIAAETKKVPPLPKAPSRSPSEPTETRKAIRPPPQPVKRRPRTSGIMWKSESWLKIVGIGLLLFGVGFLFKFSVDQGWITEPVRVGFGLVLGIGLFVIGIRIQANRQHFSQVLLGGSIAIFYITGFAAFQLYALVSHPIAFAFMVSVTLLAFFLSLRQHEAILSIIGAVGGLGTPFLLYTSAGSLPGLIAYTCLVLGGTSAIYMYRGWRSLLWTSVVGGWAVFLISYIHGGISSDRDRWILQGGIIFGWIAFWALPVIREVLGARNPARWSRPSQLFHVQSHLDSLAGSIRNLANGHVHILSVCTPLLTLALSWLIWSLSNETWGWIATGGAMIYGVAAGSLRRASGGKLLAYTQALVALLLLTIAFCLLLRGDALFFTLAAEAVVLHLISHRLTDRGIAISAHLLFAVVGLWLADRLIATPVAGLAILNAKALSYLGVIVAGSGVSVVLQSREARLVYRLAAHVAVLGWILKELSTLDSGQGYVTITWGIYAIILLIIGLRRNLNRLVMVAMGTLLLVVGKLFLVDLAKLETIWRILLFLGFGGLFLVLSYYFQDLWKSTSESAEEAE